MDLEMVQIFTGSVVPQVMPHVSWDKVFVPLPVSGQTAWNRGGGV